MPDNDLLAAAALRLADGEAIDWAAHAAGLSEPERRWLDRLRQLEALAQVHASGDDGAAAVHDSIRLGHPSATPVPVRWGPLEILDKIDRGSFGDVYRARDTRLGRQVALKLLRHREHSTDEENAVVHEGHLLSRVRHPNVVTVYGAERIDGRTGLWMEFVEGETLEDELRRRGPLPAADVVDIGMTLCGALAAVHAAGLLHRDIKLQNVMRDADGRLVLMDFGAGDEAAGGEGRLAGTPLYLAPEVLAGSPHDVSSDLYALGVVLFRLATGRFPLEGRTLAAIRAAHADAVRQPTASIRPDLPRGLAEIIDRALAPERGARFTTPAGMREALARSMPAPSARVTLRTRLVAGAAVVFLAAAGGWIAWDKGVIARFTGRATGMVPFEPRDWALVAAFDNATGEPMLDGAVEHALAHELSRSTFVNVVPRLRVNDTLELMDKPTTTRVDVGLGREVARHDGGIRVIVAGRLARAGSGYDVSARIIKPSDGAVVTRASETARDHAALLPAIQRLALTLRHALGEEVPEAERAAAGQRVTTSSLRALQLYSEALAAQSEQDARPAAERRLREALSLDPNFAMARIHLASIMLNATPQARLAEAQSALAGSAHLSEPERLFITARVHEIRGSQAGPQGERAHFERAIGAYEALTRLRPDDYRVQNLLAALYRRIQRPAEARAIHGRTAAVLPNSVRVRIQIAADLLESGDVEGARNQIVRIRTLNPRLERFSPGQAAWFALFDAHYAWLQNNPREALAVTDRVANRIAEVPPNFRSLFETHVTFMYLTLGCHDRAEQFASRSSAMGLIGPDWRMSSVMADRGDVAALRQFLNTRMREPEKARLVLSHFIDAGLLAKARELVLPDASLYRGQLALAEGRFEEAILIFEAHRRRATAVFEVTAPRTYRKLAEALVAAGRRNEAIEVLEEMSHARSRSAAVISSGFDWLRGRAYLSRLYREAGQQAKADAIDDELRTLLAVADDDHPLKRPLAARTTSRPVAPPPAPTLAALHPNLRINANIRSASADPRLVTCTPWGKMAVAVCNVETGDMRIARATSDPNVERSSAAYLSPDGRRIAYLLATGPVSRPTATSIRLVDLDGRNDRELRRTADPESGLALFGWADAGGALLIGTSNADGSTLVLLPVDRGAPTVIYQSAGRIPYWASLSHDGRFLVFTPRPGPSMSEDRLEIRLSDLRSRTDREVLGPAWRAYAPFWTPAGDILFMSNRLGAHAAYLQRMTDATPDGEPVLLREFNTNPTVVNGLAGDGTLFVTLRVATWDVFRAPIDAAAATLGTPVRAGGRSLDESQSIEWANDGAQFAYLAGIIGRSGSASRVVVRRRDGQIVRELPFSGGFPNLAMLRWSPDGTRVATVATADDKRRGLHVIDVATGSEQRLLNIPLFVDFRWIDAAHVLLASARGLERMDVRSAAVQLVTRPEPGSRVAKVAVSRDGSMLAALEIAGSDPKGCTLRVGPPDGPMTNRHVFADGWCDAMTWTPDGSRILVAIADRVPIPHPRPASLWIVPVAGGDPVRLPVRGEPIVGLSMSPDGRELLFTAGNPRPEPYKFSGFLEQVR